MRAKVMLQIHQLGAIIELAMATKKDQPLDFDKSLNDLVNTFRNVIASMTWLKASAKDAQEFYKNYLYVTELASSVTSQEIKLAPNTRHVVGYRLPKCLSTGRSFGYPRNII